MYHRHRIAKERKRRKKRRQKRQPIPLPLLPPPIKKMYRFTMQNERGDTKICRTYSKASKMNEELEKLRNLYSIYDNTYYTILQITEEE